MPPPLKNEETFIWILKERKGWFYRSVEADADDGLVKIFLASLFFLLYPSLVALLSLPFP